MSFLLAFDSILLFTGLILLCLVHFIVKKRNEAAVTYPADRIKRQLTACSFEINLLLVLFLFCGVFAYAALLAGGTVNWLGLFVFGKADCILKIFVYAFAIPVLLLRKSEITVRLKNIRPDFDKSENQNPLPIGFLAFGASMLFCADNLLSLLLCIEIMSVSFIFMFFNPYRTTDGQPQIILSDTPFTIFLLCSGTGFVMLLLGTIIFWYCGKGTSYTEIANLLSLQNPNSLCRLDFGIVFILCGLLLKIGISPFHIWITDIYQKIKPSTFAAFAVVALPALLCITSRLSVIPFKSVSFKLLPVLGFLAVLTMLWASLGALKTAGIKGFTAFVTVAGIGFAFAVIPYTGTEAGTEAFPILIYFLAPQCLALSGLIALFGSFNVKGVSPVDFSELQGIGRHYPLKSFLLIIFLLSLAGIPPFIGFIGKFGLIVFLQATGNYIALTAIIISMLLATIYTFKVITLIYSDGQPSEFEDFTLSATILLAICFIPLVLFSANEHYIPVLFADVLQAINPL